jgi:release factor glutamine methyltransferase
MDGPATPVSQRIVGELLRVASERLRAAGSETARLDAELLLANVLHVDRTSLLAHPEAQTGPGQQAAFEEAIARRETGEPVAYIRGTKEFYGLALIVDGRALIPRPETELLVELALARIRDALAGPRSADAPYNVWDVGTGSGAIVVALAVETRRRGYAGYVRFVASDVSPEALGLAMENAVGHGVADAIDFGVADLLASSPPRRADLVVANLPYVPSGAVPELPVAASFEPVDALDGGPDGLGHIRRLLEGLPEVLAQGGAALLEVGSDQAGAASEAAGTILPGVTVRVHADLGGQPRVVEVSRAAVQ